MRLYGLFKDQYDGERFEEQTMIIPICMDKHFRLIVVDGKSGNIMLFDPKEDGQDNKGIYKINDVNTEERLIKLLARPNKRKDYYRILSSPKYRLQGKGDSRNCGPYVIQAIKTVLEQDKVCQEGVNALFEELKNTNIARVKRETLLDVLLCPRVLQLQNYAKVCWGHSRISVVRESTLYR